MKLKSVFVKASALMLTAASVLLFSSCSAGGAVEGLLSLLGFDTHDYAGEAVLETLETDDPLADTLVKMTRMLSINSPLLPSFSSTKEAVQSCRDSILNHMLATNYAKFTGNLTLLDEAKAAYPQYQITTVLPGSDFENTVYMYFGGNVKVTHKSGGIFLYLDKVDAYINIGQVIESTVKTEVLSLVRTASTYRMHFKNSDGDLTSPEYLAIFRVRDDGSIFFYSVEEA